MIRTKSNTSRQLKKGVDSDDIRRKREEAALTLRKAQKEEQMLKRRQHDVSAEAQQDNIRTSKPFTREDVMDRLRNLPGLVADLNSADPKMVLATVIQFRKMLSIETDPPLQAVIDAGVVPRLVQLLTDPSQEEIQFEAAWTLTNIASGTSQQCQIVVESGALQHFVTLLSSPSTEVSEQAVWALSNIAGDSPQYRDLVTRTGAIQPLLNLIDPRFHPDQKLSLIRNATWGLSNLCRGKNPRPSIDAVRLMVPALVWLLNFNDEELINLLTDGQVVSDACWAVSYLSDDDTPRNERIQLLIDVPGIGHRLVQLLSQPGRTRTTALRTIGNIATGTDVQTSMIVEAGALPVLVQCLFDEHKSTQKEVAWAISNVTAGTQAQIQAVIDAQAFPPLCDMLRNNTAAFDVLREAVWVISNALNGGSPAHVDYLLSVGACEALCSLLTCQKPTTILTCIDGLDCLLKTRPDASERIEDCGGLSSIEGLQHHDDMIVYERVSKFLKAHFETEEDDNAEEESNLQVAPSGFGAPFQLPVGQYTFQ